MKKGSAIVEFAFALPLFLLAAMAVLDVGLLSFHQLFWEHDCRVLVRAAARKNFLNDEDQNLWVTAQLESKWGAGVRCHSSETTVAMVEAGSMYRRKAPLLLIQLSAEKSVATPLPILRFISGQEIFLKATAWEIRRGHENGTAF